MAGGLDRYGGLHALCANRLIVGAKEIVKSYLVFVPDVVYNLRPANTGLLTALQLGTGEWQRKPGETRPWPSLWRCRANGLRRLIKKSKMEILVAHEVDAGLPVLAIARQLDAPGLVPLKGASKRRHGCYAPVSAWSENLKTCGV
jgi:hypothetical protein